MLVWSRQLMRGPVLLLCLSLTAAVSAQDITFPELTGRVVDNANMLEPGVERQLAARLAAHEQATGNQVVVATLENLQGRTIEEFGYQLGRAWGIGQQGEDNGALLLVARDERAVRIEVGYGLEGELTDAISSNIIHGVILPRFRQGQFAEGIAEGATAMIEALGGEYQMRQAADGEEASAGKKALVLFLVFGGWLFLAMITTTGGRSGRGGLLMGALAAGALGGGRGGFGGGGGGFSGGGGGFGGGGASGGW